MKKNLTKQLVLKRDTIRQLASTTLIAVAGGIVPGTGDVYDSACYPTVQANAKDR